ncbi:unnamed protein product [Parascedosporium putredinis]|uniref:Serine hydrolase domain-containing protein n=1 Tax=Parascedosporium putredinis TaxID=1442378 RepID=A0A9P1HCL9_9PEZI|nr:unnamed protein product [Parascedosporium putredinis]CAI8004980.1 unnamed protein product [Parascedosporium putredinis]
MTLARAVSSRAQHHGRRNARPDPPPPRILCLHGGGVNADIFRLQCRNLIARLADTFRLVFVDGPFICPPHPTIVRVYGDHGPFRRWLRWQPDQPEIDAETAASQIRYQLDTAAEEDDLRGATGPWVAVLGFSQGAKVSAGLLYTQQKLAETLGPVGALLGPVVVMDPRVDVVPGVADASAMSTGFKGWPVANEGDHIFTIPTLHVHGLRDPGLEEHRILPNLYCGEGTTKLIEWDGDHRVPIKMHDVEAVAAEMIALGKRTGVI